MHIEEYKRMRHEGKIENIKSVADVHREQSLRLQVTGPRPGRTPKDRAKFGWLGHRGISAKVSMRTINYELRALFTFFHWAVKRNCLFLNPAANVERFRLPKRVIPKFLTSEELKKFFEACKEDDRRLFMSIVLTGMRKGEVEHLCWSDVNFELGVVFIQEKADMNWKPKSDERIIPLSPMLRGLLLEQFDRRRSDRLVFANQQGHIDTHILERLKKICAHAGIKLSTVHALRHSFGAHLRMAGVSLADIGDLLGHKDLATTQIYAKVQQEHLRTMISKLTALVGDSEPIKRSPGSSSHRGPPTRRRSNHEWLFHNGRPRRSLSGGNTMARWEPRTPKETLQNSLERLKGRIQKAKEQVKDLEGQAAKVEQAVKALG
jgi:site-specific recombinase XerD